MTRRPFPSFTLFEAALRWRVSEEIATDFIRGFIDCGFVKRSGPGRWCVTPLGFEIASRLSLADDRERAAW